MSKLACIVVMSVALAGCAAHQVVQTASPQAVSPDATASATSGAQITKNNFIETFNISGVKTQSMASGSDGNVWITEVLAKIDRITTGGVLTQFAVHTGHPCVIAAGPKGNLLASDGADIIEITTAGAITYLPLPSGSSACGGVALGPDGNFWFTDQAKSAVGNVTPGGVVTEYPVAANSDPYNIVKGPDGNLWFVEEATNAIGRITPGGSLTEFPISYSNEFPTDIVSASDGNLYVAGVLLLKVTTSGSITGYPLNNGIQDFMIQGPDKKLWLAGTYNVQQFDIKHDVAFKPVNIPRGNGHGIASGSDGNVWLGAFGGPNGYMYVITPTLTTIGVRLNGELSFNDPNYGFELGYAKGATKQTQTISVPAATYVQFTNDDTIPHIAAFLGDASQNNAPWPQSFTGGMTASPALTPIGTTGFSSGSLTPGQTSAAYATGMPGFYMIGCGYHYDTNMMRTVVIVR